MKSLALKTVNQFSLNGTHPVLQDGQEVGSISPDDPETIIVEQTNFSVFNAVYNEVVNENILVTTEDDGVIQYDQFRVPNSFKVFYSAHRHLLISAAPSQVSKPFLKALQAAYPESINLAPYNFRIDQLIENLNVKTSVSFTVDEDGVQRKRFSGDAVIDNNEAATAVERGAATFLIGKADLLGRERTLGFNVGGSLLIYSNPNDIDQTYPFLNLTLSALDELVNP